MVRKSKKVVEKVENPVEIQENPVEIQENPVEIQENPVEVPEDLIEMNDIETDPQEKEEIAPPQDNIIETLKVKKNVSKKQSEHLKQARQKMIESEREKKQVMKKVKELMDLNVDLDDVIVNAKKLKVKNDYEKLFGKRKDDEQLVTPVSTRNESVNPPSIKKTNDKYDKLRSFFN